MYGGGQRSLQSSKQRSLSTGDLKSTQRTGEQQTKIVNQSIVRVETHYPQLVQDLNTYIVRTAKLRDSGDNLHKSFVRYAQDESPALKGNGQYSLIVHPITHFLPNLICKFAKLGTFNTYFCSVYH